MLLLLFVVDAAHQNFLASPFLDVNLTSMSLTYSQWLGSIEIQQPHNTPPTKISHLKNLITHIAPKCVLKKTVALFTRTRPIYSLSFFYFSREFNRGRTGCHTNYISLSFLTVSQLIIAINLSTLERAIGPWILALKMGERDFHHSEKSFFQGRAEFLNNSL